MNGKTIILSLVFLIAPFFSSVGTPFDFSFNNTDMKTLSVKKLLYYNENPSLEEISNAFDTSGIEFESIDVVNWNSYPYKPDVKFRIAYSENELFLEFFVREDNVRGVYDYDFSSKPYTDSCVEFFVSLSDSVYYNLEMNCIGHGTFACGADRKNRIRFNDDIISLIRRSSSLGSSSIGQLVGETQWNVVIAIPLKLFSLNDAATSPDDALINLNEVVKAGNAMTGTKLNGKTARANFYKCGDDMAVPHYISWNPIGCPRPDFHRPEYFGTLKFE